MAQIPVIIGSGLLSARPAASAANEGYLYFATDGDGVLYRSNGSTWDQVAASVAAESGQHAAVTLGADADTLLGLSTQEITLDVQNANKVLAGPTTGADADPTFRALVSADLPFTGTPDGTKYLKDDLSWDVPPGLDETSHDALDHTGLTGILSADSGEAFVFDGGGAVIATGEKGSVPVFWAGTITGWQLVGEEASGDIVVDVKKAAFASFPGSAASIWGGSKPTISGAQTAEATGLSIACSKGDWLQLVVDSVSTFTRATLALYFERD